MFLGNSLDAVQVTYRDGIETLAGETRHNIFVIVAKARADGAVPKVVISSSILPNGITAGVSNNWTGPAGWSEVAFSISVSAGMAAGVYMIGYEASIDGGVPYLLQGIITVVKVD